MRLIVTILWIVAAVCWLPWFALAIRLIVDIAAGTPWDYSNFVRPALMGIWPDIGLGLWPLERLARWRIVSLYPVSAFIGVVLVAAGWRVYWREQDGLLTRPAWLVTLSILVPPLAPLLMWGDARRRHLARETQLEADVREARERIRTADGPAEKEL